MKTNMKKTRNVKIFALGIVGALAGPLVGWVMCGLCPGGFDLFLQNYPEKVAVYGIIGFVVGIAAGALLSTVDFINQRDKEESEKKDM